MVTYKIVRSAVGMSEELIHVDPEASFLFHKNLSNKFREKYIAIDNYIL